MHPEWKTKQPFAAVLDNDFKALAASGEKGLVELVAVTHAGMTTAEFSMRFLVSGPVSSHFCLPHVPKRGSSPGVSVEDGDALHYAARTELRLECRVLGIMRMFQFIFGIEVIKVAEEFVEAVHGGQEFVAIAKMVLAELPGGITLRLQKLGDGRILGRTGLPWPQGRPTLRSPVRDGLCPVMKAARPAVQDCCP